MKISIIYSLLLSLTTLKTCKSEVAQDGAKSIPFHQTDGRQVKVDNCKTSRLENAEHLWCGDNAETLCAVNSVVFTHVVWDSPQWPHIYSCQYIVECSGVSRIGLNCRCSKTYYDCFDHIKGCVLPKSRSLQSPQCSNDMWASVRPTFCSIIQHKVGCTDVGIKRPVHWVVGPDHVKRYVDKLRINMVPDEIKPFSDPYVTNLKNSRGSEAFCRHTSRTHSECFKNVSDEGIGLFDIPRFSSVPYYTYGDCSSPVYCFGTEELLTFDNLSPDEDNCEGCLAVCHAEEVSITLPNSRKRTIEICGVSWCHKTQTTKHSYSYPRTSISRMEDKIIRIKIMSLSGKSRSLVTNCEIYEGCDAITCWFCWERWLNFGCYTTWQIILVSIIVLISLSFILKCIFLIIFFFRSIIALVYNVFYGIFRILFSITRFAKRRVKRNLTSMAEIISNDNEERTALVERPQRPRPRNPEQPIWLKSLALTMLFNPALCSMLHSHHDCVSTHSIISKNEDCVILNDQATCSAEGLIKIPIKAYHNYICLFILDNQNRVAELIKLKFTTVSLRCERDVLYHTRQYKLTTDRVIRCPGVDPCSVEWCNSYGPESKDHLLPDIKRPGKRYCMLGDACWINGCFICTSSCHAYHWYANPISDNLYSIQSCPAWSKIARIEVIRHTQTTTVSKNITLHSGIKASLLDLDLKMDMADAQFKEGLSKKFLWGPRGVAIVDAPAKGDLKKGTLGEVQCSSKHEASIFEDCKIAQDACFCQPTKDEDFCTCSELDINKFFDQDNMLPIRKDGEVWYVEDKEIYITPAFNAAPTLDITSHRKIVTNGSKINTCIVQPYKVYGCYNCRTGAVLKYTCTSDKEGVVILSCGNTQISISCTLNATQLITSFSYEGASVDLECSSHCLKDAIRLTGNLVSWAVNALNGIQDVSLEGPLLSRSIWDIIGDATTSLWVRVLLIGILILFLIIGIIKLFFGSRFSKAKYS